MTDVVGETAHEVIEKSIDWLLDHADHNSVWGGTIPDEFGEDEEPNDFKRDMREWYGGFSYRLTDPTRRWSSLSNHWPGITLRETEDDLFALNPGMTPEYSIVYREWLKDSENLYPHTYGQRIFEHGRQTIDPEDPVPGTGYDDRNPVVDQWESAIRLLEREPTTRKATITIADPGVDSRWVHHDTNAYVPCNLEIHPTIRDGELHWAVYSRSKDILRGSTENLFEFPLLQEIMAHELDVEVGEYVEHVRNLHIYEEQIRDGYLDQDPVDPYDHWDPDPVSPPWHLEATFSHIDDHLREHDWDTALGLAESVDDPYWRDWKSTLAIEYLRMNDGPEDLYRTVYADLERPWKQSLAQRSVDTWGSQPWIADGLPEVFHRETRSL